MFLTSQPDTIASCPSKLPYYDGKYADNDLFYLLGTQAGSQIIALIPILNHQMTLITQLLECSQYADSGDLDELQSQAAAQRGLLNALGQSLIGPMSTDCGASSDPRVLANPCLPPVHVSDLQQVQMTRENCISKMLSDALGKCA